MAGVERRMDLFGVLLLSCAAATAGGITRDVLIGAIPPEGLNNWLYVSASLGAGLITFLFPSMIKKRWNPILIFDAAGLALFAVTGAHKALVYGGQPHDCNTTRYVDGHRRRYGSGYPPGTGPDCPALRTVCRVGSSGSNSGRTRRVAQSPPQPDDSRGRRAVFCAARPLRSQTLAASYFACLQIRY